MSLRGDCGLFVEIVDDVGVVEAGVFAKFVDGYQLMRLLFLMGFNLRKELTTAAFAFAGDTLDVLGIYAEAGEFHIQREDVRR